MTKDYLIDEATGEAYIQEEKGKLRINKDTGEIFKKGDLREDGATFNRYKPTYHKVTNFRQERWRTPRPEGKRRLNPKTGKELEFSSILPQDLEKILKTLRNIDK